MSKVYLAGAGPFSEKLISLGTLEIIKKADVIIYDKLVNKNLINMRKEGAKLFYVGKKSEGSSSLQDYINELIYEASLKYDIVLRLKGGDPYIFARGSEEAMYLYERGVDFEIVPGISSAIAAGSYAGIPLTHRAVSRSFHVFTGHDKDDGISLDFENIAKLEGSLVFLMSVKNMKIIKDELIKNGMDENRDVAAIYMASSNSQRKYVSKLKDLDKLIDENRIKPPTVFIVGDTVAFNDKLDFFGKRRLKDRTFILTRSRSFNESLKEKLLDMKADVLELDMIKYSIIESEEMTRAVKNIKDYDFLILSSRNAVRFFMDYLFKYSIDIRELAYLKIATIGAKTDKELYTYGIKSDIISKKYSSDCLISTLVPFIKPGDRVLYPHSDKAKGNIANFLKDFNTDDVILYKNSDEDYEGFEIEDKVYDILFFSSSEVYAFHKYFKDIMKKSRIYSIGPYTSATIRSLSYEVYGEAESHDEDGMYELIRRQEDEK